MPSLHQDRLWANRNPATQGPQAGLYAINQNVSFLNDNSRLEGHVDRACNPIALPRQHSQPTVTTSDSLSSPLLTPRSVPPPVSMHPCMKASLPQCFAMPPIFPFRCPWLLAMSDDACYCFIHR